MPVKSLSERKEKNGNAIMAANKKAARKRRAQKMRVVACRNGICRLGVFRSLRHIYAQVFSLDGTSTLASSSTMEKAIAEELKGLNKSQAAELIGKRLAKRALESGIEKVAFDRSGYAYLGRIRALASGARQAGLKF